MKAVQINQDKSAITLASEINLIKEQTNKFLLQSSIEIGKRLKEAKEIVGHGNWSQWLEQNVNYSQRTATNLIKICDEYGSMMLESGENSNRQSLANLGYTQAVSMLKLDFEERENFVLENDVESMTTRELEAAIKEKNDALEEKRKLEVKVKRILDEKVALENDLKSKDEELSIHDQDVEAYKKQVEELENKLKTSKALEKEIKESKAKGKADPDKIKALEASLKSSNDQITELTNQLAEKSQANDKTNEAELVTEIEVIKEVEVINEALTNELADLKTKLKASESTVKYKATFEVIVNLFNDLITILGEIESTDPKQYAKYKGATNKLLDQLKQ